MADNRTATKDIAPDACIVCNKAMPRVMSNAGWVYLAGVVPVGAVACSAECVREAIDRELRTGRVDKPHEQ